MKMNEQREKNVKPTLRASMFIYRKSIRIGIAIVGILVVVIVYYVFAIMQVDSIAKARSYIFQVVAKASLISQGLDPDRYDVHGIVDKCGLPLQICPVISINSFIMNSPEVVNRLINDIQAPCKTLLNARNAIRETGYRQTIGGVQTLLRCGNVEHEAYQIAIAIRFVKNEERIPKEFVNQQMITVNMGNTNE